MGFIFLRYILKHCSLWIGNYSISTINLEQNGNTVRNSCHWKFLRDQFEMLYSYETELSGDVKQQIFPPVRNRNCIAYHAFVFTFSNSFGDLKGVWCPRFLSRKRKTIFIFSLRVFIPKTFYKVSSLTSRIGWFINLKSWTIGIALMTFKKSLKFVCKHLNINLNIVHKLVVWRALTWNKECEYMPSITFPV